jgi:hypothetical protein
MVPRADQLSGRPTRRSVVGRTGSRRAVRAPDREGRHHSGGQDRVPEVLCTGQWRVLEQYLCGFLRCWPELQLRAADGQDLLQLGHRLGRFDHSELEPLPSRERPISDWLPSRVPGRADRQGPPAAQLTRDLFLLAHCMTSQRRRGRQIAVNRDTRRHRRGPWRRRRARRLVGRVHVAEDSAHMTSCMESVDRSRPGPRSRSIRPNGPRLGWFSPALAVDPPLHKLTKPPAKSATETTRAN